MDYLNIDVVGNRDQHTDEDISSWLNKPFVLDSSGLNQSAIRLSRWLREHSPDIVHSHFIWSYASLATVRWKKNNPKKQHLISPRGMLDPWAVNHSRWKKKVAAWLFESKHLKTAACIHALCESEARSIRQFGLTNPICIIPNGIDLPEIDKESANKSRSSGQKKRMLFIGRIHSKKGIIQLLEAWSKSVRSLRDWSLEIGGWDDGGHLTEVESTIQKLELARHVSLLGPLFGDAKKTALLNADAFVLPSFSEGLPMSILEAWAYQLPVLMTEECNIPIGFSANAAFQISNDPQQLADQLVQFAKTDASELAVMGKNGRKLVEEKFQWRTIANQMADVYQWVMGYRDRPETIITV